MALNGDALGLVIKNAIHGLTNSQKQNPDEVFKAMGNAIVTYIVANAQVVVTSVTGVTTGAGASGPGTGTIT